MAAYTNNSYPNEPAFSFYASAGKVFHGGIAYTPAASSTEEKALLIANDASSGVQVQVVDFRCNVLTLGAGATATSAIVKLYMVELAGLSASGTSASAKNALFGGAASVHTYHTSATATATATTALPLKLEASTVGGSVSLEILQKHPIIIPEGYALQASVTGPAGSVPVVAIDYSAIEI